MPLANRGGTETGQLRVEVSTSSGRKSTPVTLLTSVIESKKNINSNRDWFRGNTVVQVMLRFCFLRLKTFLFLLILLAPPILLYGRKLPNAHRHYDGRLSVRP